MKSTNGFTLVELLVVIVVITILATVTVIAYSSVLDDAYKSRLKADASNITKAVKLYKSKYGVVPLCAGGNSTTCNLSTLNFGTFTVTMPIAERAQYTYVGNNTASVNKNWAVRAHTNRTGSEYCKFGDYPNYPGWFSTTVDCMQN